MSFNINDRAIVAPDSESYTGKYAGTEVTIIKVDTDKYVTVQASDEYKFMCPLAYLISIEEYKNPPKCECGAETIGTSYHYTWCPKETR